MVVEVVALWCDLQLPHNLRDGLNFSEVLANPRDWRSCIGRKRAGRQGLMVCKGIMGWVEASIYNFRDPGQLGTCLTEGLVSRRAGHAVTE